MVYKSTLSRRVHLWLLLSGAAGSAGGSWSEFQSTLHRVEINASYSFMPAHHNVGDPSDQRTAQA